MSDENRKLPRSPSFVVERELRVSPRQRKLLNSLLEDVRKIRNTVLAMAKKRYRCMLCSYPYRNLIKQLREVNKELENKPRDPTLIELRKKLILSLKELNKEYRLSKFEFEKDAKIVRKYFHNRIDSASAQKAANRAWMSFAPYMRKKSKRLHFLKYGENFSFEGKSNESGLIVKLENGEIKVQYCKQDFQLMPVKKNDLYMMEIMSLIRSFFEIPADETSAIQENNKLQLFFKNGQINQEEYLNRFCSTYRVKYNRLIKKIIRGRERFFLQMIIEGRPIPKRTKDGRLLHQIGKGTVGNDLGTQTVAVASDERVALYNLAENIDRMESRLKRIQRKMDRSRRKANPENYHDDGRIRKGAKEWNYSKRYFRLRAEAKEIYRKTAVKRKLAHQTLVNQLVTLGDVFFVEKMNFHALQKRKKETEKDAQGKYKKKRRFGKTIANKAPAMFTAIYKNRVEQLGGTFKFVHTQKFRASQYDHVSRKPVKKELSERWHILADGTRIQRDLYSSFLLKCSDGTLEKPDFEQCAKEFNSFLEKHNQFINQTVASKSKIVNSSL